MNHKNSFYNLTPDQVLMAVERAGFYPTGRYLQLNSYENRVFDLWLEEDSPNLTPNNLRIIAKFYRPGRWSKEAIEEEHAFLKELQDADIPAVAPLYIKYNNINSTVFKQHDLWCGLFPRTVGRMPEELNHSDLQQIGRNLARIHNVGAKRKAIHRPILNAETYGWSNLKILKNHVSPEVWPRYNKAATQILEFLEDSLDQDSFIRIHGDCHKGNLLKTDFAGQDSQFFFVDFDDFCNGPSVQDFWMLLSGDSDVEEDELSSLLSGYEDLREFNDQEFSLILPLRGLRIIHYAAWIARRWQDPSFPQLFPQFKDYTYWAEETEALEKISWEL